MFKIEITRKGLSAIGKRGFQEIGRAAVTAAANYWREKYLPLHFKMVAYRRYGYTARSAGYTESKLKRRKWGDFRAIGDPSPLVFTGRSRERALNTKNIKAKAPDYQTYRADIVIDAPAFNFGADKRIDMRDEVKRVNPQEEKTLEKVFAKEWESQLIARGLRGPRRTRRIT